MYITLIARDILMTIQILLVSDNEKMRGITDKSDFNQFLQNPLFMRILDVLKPN